MTSGSLLPEFRPIGAIDNNLQDPALNPTPGSAEVSLTPANFAPGTTAGLAGGPNPRTISNVVSGGPGATVNDPQASAWIYAFGQFVDHDLDLEQTGTTPINIAVPSGDPNFGDGSSILLNRAVTDPATGTAINTVAGYLDLSQVYGSDAATAASLRNDDGTLKTTAGDNLPIVDGAFVSGDVRVMENPELTAITTMFVREHNNWVGQLRQQNPTWTGDQLYNMAKAITTAEYQNIIYNEYLPALVGNAVGPYTGYDPTVNPQVTQEFSTAAFRVGHTQVSGNQQGLDNSGNVTYTESLAQAFSNTPAQDTADGAINALIRDLSSDYSQATDVYAVDGLRNLLVSDPDKMDLIAIDIQRERDLGLGTLNETRQALGLPQYTSFDQLTSDPTVQANLRSVYGSIDNVDLFIGGLAETHVAGALVGQTFQTIIASQFDALRTGDRFFWQNENFDPATAQTISQTTLGDIIQRDTGTAVVQQNVFLAAQRHPSNAAAADPATAQLVIGIDDPGAQISGGPADDTIVAGLGADQRLTGGGGNDTFVFLGTGHTDTVTDYLAGTDTLDFKELPTGLDPNNLTVGTASDGSAMVHYNGNTITLTGVSPSQMSASDYLFNGHAASAAGGGGSASA
jgi:peroxidase